MHDALRNYLEIRTANATGYTVEQVRTITLLEQQTDRGYESECRAAQRGEPVYARVESFKVEHDQRLNLPRVTFYDCERDWMEHEVAVLRDGKLDRTL